MPLRLAITGVDRPALRNAARQRFRMRPDGPVLMVTGGSKGARAINAAVSGAAAALRAAGVQVLHITGPQNVAEVTDGDPADPPHVVIPYVGEMEYAYAGRLRDLPLGDDSVRRTADAGLPAAYVPLALGGSEKRLKAEPPRRKTAGASRWSAHPHAEPEALTIPLGAVRAVPLIVICQCAVARRVVAP
jgi:UDP-N-acetylglucosamine--N-acetylmuramyl-(pentapeptide) pyrophosphoryl-undecaprenol N-acetylglucosamine transferase